MFVILIIEVKVIILIIEALVFLKIQYLRHSLAQQRWLGISLFIKHFLSLRQTDIVSIVVVLLILNRIVRANG